MENKEITMCVPSNEEAWNKESYNAWIERFGTPDEAAKKLKLNPIKPLSTIYNKFGQVQNKKIMNLMGSNGYKATALALLGAQVSVVDFSIGNKKYAEELAKEAGVNIRYILSDVLQLSNKGLDGVYDIVFAEMGILHYFLDLAPFVDTIYNLLNKDGIVVIRDFHPISTKLITSRGSTAKVRKHKVTGDYFDSSLEEKEVAYSKYLKEEEKPEKVLLRKWNLGEIVTAFAQRGLTIKELEEEPNLSGDAFDKGIPKTFILVAQKI